MVELFINIHLYLDILRKDVLDGSAEARSHEVGDMLISVAMDSAADTDELEQPIAITLPVNFTRKPKRVANSSQHGLSVRAQCIFWNNSLE